MNLIGELVEFAESEFKLNALQDDKQPLRVHLESLWRQTGKMPQLLEDAPECPPLGAHVWGWFVELHSERRMGMAQAERITAADMKDWCWATGNQLELWERQAIRRIDSAWMKAQNHD